MPAPQPKVSIGYAGTYALVMGPPDIMRRLVTNKGTFPRPPGQAVLHFMHGDKATLMTTATINSTQQIERWCAEFGLTASFGANAQAQAAVESRRLSKQSRALKA